MVGIIALESNKVALFSEISPGRLLFEFGLLFTYVETVLVTSIWPFHHNSIHTIGQETIVEMDSARC